jgi:3-oxoacyl-[acyl-carrier protein] reductase
LGAAHRFAEAGGGDVVITSLTNKTTLVTGVSRGIGQATALVLAAAGARAVVHCGRKADEAKAVVEQIRVAGGRTDLVAADLAPPDARIGSLRESVF